ncbi:argininosuccinate lyase [Falsigemmobacter faecalis]|uniref:Argininosuccinate lyase n=1 Tax=Falsigemmobacter faecalis TaxID=2488730 RepID=A0A3P3DMU1_9RHOB|nr:argininosuccinate lyase [Falsigemmobacter faecalis]RRH73928.1 argininosuccinate lyase [Falsigemmobacter faecalis]
MPYFPALLMTAALVLSACGADGPPVPPQEVSRQSDGLSISGTARMGLTYNSQPGLSD